MHASFLATSARAPATVRHLKSAIAIGLRPTGRNLLLWTISGCALAAIVVMSAALTGSQVYGWEVDLTERIQDVSYPEWAFRLTADRLTNADTIEGATVISLIAAGLWLVGLKIEGALVIFSVALHVLGNTPKLVVERTSPEPIDGVTWPEGMSFPSGHAEFAITFYGFLAYLLLLRLNGPFARGLLITGWLALVLVVGFARVDSGDHWPLDVLGGYIAGVGLLAVLVWLHASLTQAARASAEGRDAREGVTPPFSRLVR